MDELISIIIPVYNVENYLDRCLETVVSQTYKNLEIILVNDGSTDSSGKICDKWALKDNRIVVIHKINGGLSDARNVGMDHATGEYIGFVDSDDWINKQMYEILYDLLKNNPDCQIAECGFKYLDKKENIKDTEVYLGYRKMDRKDMFDYFFRVNGEKSNTAVWKYLIKREIAQNLKFKGRINEDVLYSFDLFCNANNMISTSRKLYYYFKNDKGLTRKPFCVEDLNYLKIWDYIYEKVQVNYPEYSKYAHFARIRADFTMLSKMKIRGFDKKNSYLNQLKNELKESVRKNIKELIKSNMPLSRKVLVLLVSI